MLLASIMLKIMLALSAKAYVVVKQVKYLSEQLS